jgi:hypothetical protein
MPRLSLGLGVSSSSKLPSGGAAPSGIVAATAGDLIISFGYFDPATYTKISNIFWNFNFGEGDSEYQRLQWNSFTPNTWTLDVNNGDIVATNPSLDSTTIPTTGWIYIIGSGPSITITAA